MSPEGRRPTLPALKEQWEEVTKGLRAPRDPFEVKKLSYVVAARSDIQQIYSVGHPPEFLFHTAQMENITLIALKNQPLAQQFQSMIFVHTHDFGRSLVTGNGFNWLHPFVGAKMLKQLGFDTLYIEYALAHHHWGLGEARLGDASILHRIQLALSNENEMDSLYGDLKKRWGIGGLMVLLADNSKTPAIPPDFRSEIAPFRLERANELIEAQIIKGAFTEGSETHRMELAGARFLSELVPRIEQDLGIEYEGFVIPRAIESWQEQKQHVISLWNETLDIHL